MLCFTKKNHATLHPMKQRYSDLKKLFTDKVFLHQLLAGALLLCLGAITTSLANTYATAHMGPSVPDIFIWGISSDNVVIPYIWSAILFIVFTLAVVIKKPNTLPFLLFGLAAFYIIRSGFIVLTNPGLPEGIVGIDTVSPFIKKFFFGGDLFFSGHAGAPFFVALTFWEENSVIRTLFLALSIASGIIVLVGHYHYSVDVAAAYFITYTIYKIACYWFPVAHNYFLQK